MLEQAYDRHELQRYVAAVRAALPADELRDTVAATSNALGLDGDPVRALQAALPDVQRGLASSGGRANQSTPFLSRNPVQSLLQSALEEKLRARGVKDRPPPEASLFDRIVYTLWSYLHPVRFGPDDYRWVTEVAAAMLERLSRGNHDFNPQPAEREIGADAMLVIVGDWGSGLPRARAVASHMAAEVSEALAAGREVHVIHLGDVYYSGTEEEDKRHVLALWPVSVEQAGRGVTSWSLNGNHDMYGGGYGYFDTLLADGRFAGQRSADGRPTSWFRLRAPSWDFVALDTAWSSEVFSEGHVGVLEDPQAAYVAEVARDPARKLCLLSHHQLLSVYDPEDLGPELSTKLAPVLGTAAVDAWIWGHEHRCMGFAAASGVRFPRCLGNGGVPVQMTHTDPVPPPGLWEERGSFEADGCRWARFGFAVLDLRPGGIDIRYRNEQGEVTRTETLA